MEGFGIVFSVSFIHYERGWIYWGKEERRQVRIPSGMSCSSIYFASFLWRTFNTEGFLTFLFVFFSTPKIGSQIYKQYRFFFFSENINTEWFFAFYIYIFRPSRSGLKYISNIIFFLSSKKYQHRMIFAFYVYIFFRPPRSGLKCRSNIVFFSFIEKREYSEGQRGRGIK